MEDIKQIKSALVSVYHKDGLDTLVVLSLIHISEPTRPLYISYAVFCLKKKNKKQTLIDCVDSSRHKNL